MENRRKYIYWALMGPTLTAAALALSSGGMYFIENLSIQLFEDEPSPAMNLWVIAFSTVILAAFMIFSVWLSEKEDSTSKEIKVTVEDWQNKDENDTDMEWIQEDTKCFGAWGFFDVRDITNHDDGSKYKEVPY